MTTRYELTFRGDPILKNELLKAASAALYSKRKPLVAAQMFIRNLRDERDAWGEQAHIKALSDKNRGLPPLVTPCSVTWTHLRTNGGRVDTAAIAHATWGILDGLVRAGLLPDDDYRHVPCQSYRVEVAGYEGIRVLLETVPS